MQEDYCHEQGVLVTQMLITKCVEPQKCREPTENHIECNAKNHIENHTKYNANAENHTKYNANYQT